MGIYLYCVIPAGSVAIDGLKGLDHAPVQSFAGPVVDYWYSRLAKRPEPSVEGIREHNAVVEAAITGVVTPLPLRFGQWFEDESRLEERLAPLRAQHQEKLASFQGALEFGLRIIDPREERDSHPEPVAASTGREYLLRLKEQQSAQLGAQVEPLAARVTELFSGIVREEKVEPLRTAHGLISTAHLVAREHFSAWRDRVEVLRAEYPELRFLASGPWPPYSFAA